MPGTTCSVRGCHNNSVKKKLSLFLTCLEHGKLRSECCGPAFMLWPPPASEEDLRGWLKALNLKHPPKYPYVCSYHFVEGKPTPTHPYPEKWLGYPPSLKKPGGMLAWKSNVPNTSDSSDEDAATELNEKAMSENHPDHGCAAAVPSFGHSLQCHRATQCSGPFERYKVLLCNDHRSFVYTGLSLEEFKFLADYLLKDHTNSFQLDARDQVLMTLMKLRLNLLQEELAERFHVSQPIVSQIMSAWLDIMEEKMHCFIPWLPRETIFATMPQCFKEHYPKTTCVIDCSETPVQKPYNLDSRGEFYSHYYAQYTIKYLVAMAPCGLIMFVSAAYGGRCSDKFITSHSGFLEHLHPEDVVMADCGFSISELLQERQVELVIPAKKGLHLSEQDTTDTRHIASVRVQVERVTRRLKNFKILRETIPINLVPKLNKIVRICAALCNLRGEIGFSVNML